MEGEPTEAPKSPVEVSSQLSVLPPASQSFFPVLEKGTVDFDRRFHIQEDSSRSIFMGILKSGQVVAIERLNDCNEDVFRENLQMLARELHPNLINLLGYYTIFKEHYLLFEYESCDLESRLHRDEMEPLTWSARLLIAAAVAKGLKFLHHVAVPPVIYGDIQSYNVLLSESLGIKLFDAFRHSKLEPSSSSVAGCGYRAPECGTGEVTFKSDVYSFGILLLELISGKKAADDTRGNENELLLHWVIEKMIRWEFDKVIDPIAENTWSVMVALKIALTCTEQVQLRPTMEEVSRYLENAIFGGGWPVPLKFTYIELQDATNYFTEQIFVRENIGVMDTFGIVSKGTLLEPGEEGKQRGVAVYFVDGLSSTSLKNVYLRFGLRHQNVAGLVGFCVEQAFIVTEFEAPQRILTSHIHCNAAVDHELYLDWSKRMRIATEVAHAIDYMHNVAIPRVVCGEVTSSCILVGSEEAKLCLNRSLRAKKLPGCCAPELSSSDSATFKSDIYSYGILVLELISGRRRLDERFRGNQLLEWVKSLEKNVDILDYQLWMASFKCHMALERVASLALKCVEDEIEKRPSITEIIEEMKLVEEITSEEMENQER